MAGTGKRRGISRRGLLIGGGAAIGLVVAWQVWPRRYHPNLIADPAHAEAKKELAARLEKELRDTKDARVVGDGEVWETYKRYSAIRSFPPPGKE